MYGLPSGGDWRTPRDFLANDFWHTLTLEPKYKPSIAHATSIRNQCFRYIDRLMANTVFGRGDSESIMK